MEYSHFDCLGFKMEEQSDMIKILDDTLPKAEGFNKAGREFTLFDDEGIQISCGFKNGKIQTMNPHFEGKSRNKVAINKMEVDAHLDCKVYAWIQPDESLQDGMSPMIFNFPDFFRSDNCPEEKISDSLAGWFTRLFRKPKTEIPSMQTIQLAAFPEEITFYANEAAYDKEQPDIEGTGLKLGKEFFIPAGMFADKNEPVAQLSGEVKEVKLVPNSLTGNKFYHILLEGILDFDVVIPEFAVEQTIKKGNIIKGTFWLSGKIIQ